MDRVRTAALTGTLAIAVSLAIATAPATAAKYISCRAPHSVVKAAEGNRSIVKRSYENDSYEVFYVCDRRRLRARPFFAWEEQDYGTVVLNWRLAGRYAACVEASTRSADRSILLFDIVARKQLARLTTTPSESAFPQLALTATGLAIWTDGDQVKAQRAGGQPAVLGSTAAGDSISADSLALSPSQRWVYWRGDSGAAYSAAVS